MRALAHGLATTLTESKRFFDAATVHQEYLSDIPTAVNLLCKGYHFADAIRIASSHNEADLLNSVIDVGLVEGMGSMTELIAECKSQLHAQVPRIRELRQKKKDDPLAFFDEDGGADGLDLPDDVSIAPTDASTTGGSLFTRYTGRSSGTLATNASRRSSKNRRREERKRARGKKGSVHEEEYLVNSVRRLIERVNSVNADIERLVTGLLRRGMRERARALQTSMTELVGLCRLNATEVFTPMEGQEVGMDVDQKIQAEVPLVKDFQTLSILS